jgi:hypothetical protein
MILDDFRSEALLNRDVGSAAKAKVVDHEYGVSGSFVDLGQIQIAIEWTVWIDEELDALVESSAHNFLAEVTRNPPATVSC